MSEHITQWIEAYHDGELQGYRLARVEQHLATCATCRRELAELKALSSLLQGSSPPEPRISPEAFTARVMRKLPPHPEKPFQQQLLETAWWTLPLGLLGTQAVAQVTLMISTLALRILQLGMGGTLAAEWLASHTSTPSLLPNLELTNGFLASMGEIAEALIQNGAYVGWPNLVNLTVLVVIGILYWSWLATWWIRSQRQQSNIQKGHA